ncbi:TPA: hypothetical protein ACS8CD_003590 [Providencia alcalifaciens]|uniref:Uncharacterized protein n=1 Tax=Providencia alcalifaciens TaxID=126385 RepID=A0AAW9VC37_9GAMM|nr:hypothetical protein [Providencia alcalifaciens]EKT62603.1 hypothetical protein OO9_18336 [Providencia alcalifaciens Dmel2]MTC35176.1 hypothetical protein [Providencia alcalifaciens]
MVNTPTIKKFERGDRIYVQAQQIWLILVTLVEHNKSSGVSTITYGELAEKMGHSSKQAGRTLGRQLGIIGQLCLLNDLPPLNCIVVNQQTKQPGSEVVLSSIGSIEKDQKAVFRTNWFNYRVPTAGTFRTVWENVDNWI